MLKLVVLSCVIAAACAGIIAPLAYTSPLAYTAPLAYTTPLGWTGSNYRGPLSLAPGQPANIIAADGRPLDTLDVNLDRSAHIVAKALNGGVHLLKKRSVPVIAPITLLASRIAVDHAPLISYPVGVSRNAPIAHVSPYTTFTTVW